MNRRPVLIDINPFNLLLPALVSILHRLSGVFIFFFIPFLLYALQASLQSEQNFASLKSYFANPLLQALFWLALSALFFHLVAGVRHMLMDMHIGESKYGGKVGAFIVLMVSFFFALGLAALMWVKHISEVPQ